MPTPRNLLNLKAVAKGYGDRLVLHEVTLGVAVGERIGAGTTLDLGPHKDRRSPENCITKPT